MAEHRIRDTFNKRFFDIPKYQRGFAWEKPHIRELYEDIIESIEINSEHQLLARTALFTGGNGRGGT